MEILAIIIVLAAVGFVGIALACASGKAIEGGDELGRNRNQK